MMDPDKELALLEKEFPKSRRAWIRDTPVELDDRILSLAERHAPYLQASNRLKAEQARLKQSLDDGGLFLPTKRPLKGRRPGSRIPPQLSESWSNLDESMPSASTRPPASRRATVPPGAKQLLVSLKSAEQQTWLDTIADIVKYGDIELATYLLRRYRTKFPRE